MGFTSSKRDCSLSIKDFGQMFMGAEKVEKESKDLPQ